MGVDSMSAGVLGVVLEVCLRRRDQEASWLWVGLRGETESLWTGAARRNGVRVHCAGISAVGFVYSIQCEKRILD
jgi:hypothetical protein